MDKEGWGEGGDGGRSTVGAGTVRRVDGRWFREGGGRGGSENDIRYPNVGPVVDVRHTGVRSMI